MLFLEMYWVELLGSAHLKSDPTIYGNNQMDFHQIINLIWLTQSNKKMHF